MRRGLKIALLGCVAFALSQEVPAHGQIVPWTRQPAAGSSLWLRADAGVTTDGGTVSAWADQSGRGNDAAMTIASRRPSVATGALNGLPVIRFGGVHSLTLDSDVDLMSFTVFVVGKNNNPTESIGMILGPAGTGPNNQLRWENGTQALLVGTSLPLTISTVGNTRVHHALAVRYDGSQMTVFRDGEPTSTSSFTLGQPWTLRQVGAYYSSSFLIGDLAEILIYDRSLTEAEMKQTTSYLRLKYLLR